MLKNRREIGRHLAEMRRERRLELGRPAILEELQKLDEAVLDRRRLASEQRRWDRLRAELDAFPSSETEKD